MTQKWNLQDIRPAGASRERQTRAVPERPKQDIAPRHKTPQEQETSFDTDISTLDIVDGNSNRKKRIFTWVIVAVLILGAGYFVNILLSGSEITVYPKFKDVSVQATFTAYKEPQTDKLGYELLTLEATGERQVTAKGQEAVSERALGTIFIYNTKNTSSQRLIKNTRFETSDGLIFRINESVEVPGITKNTKGEIVPGVITADVFADGTGEQYNIAPSRFTVPGLKGTDQYDSIYAESTSAFTGGFEGNKYILDEDELNTTKQALQIELRDSLLARLETEKPAGFILYKDAITFAYDSLPSTAYGDTLATIKEKARLQVPLFKETDFARYLADSTVPGYENEPIEITEPLSLTFEYASATTSKADISTFSELEFNLSGSARLVWQFDAEKLKKDAVGLPKSALKQILEGNTSILKANATVRPFWKQSFPNNPDNITVTTVVGE